MPGLTVHFEVLNQLNSPALYADTLANRPAAQLVGRIFFRTDSPFGIYRDTGTAWDLIASPDTTGITGTLAAGQVPYATGTATVAGTNNFFWDTANNRLGIGTNAPGVPLDIHGTGTITHFNGTGTSNSFVNFQNAGSGKWRLGNNYSGGTNYFSIFDQTNSIESFKITAGAINNLTINGTTTLLDTLSITKNQDASTQILLSNTTSGANSTAEIRIDSDINSGTLVIGKHSSTKTSYKIVSVRDAFLTNVLTAGDIAILNDFATGKIKFSAGGSSTAQATLTAAGRLLLGTTTESTYQLDVNGTARVSGGIAGSLIITSSYFGILTGTSGLSISNNNNSTELFRLFNNGNLLLQNGGTFTDAGYRLDVNGTARVSGGTAGSLIITSSYFGILTGTSGLSIANNNNSTELFRLFNNGNFLLQNGGTFTDISSARLQINSTTQGFLPPRMTTTQKNAISSPAQGLMIFDTTLVKLCVYSGTAWETITSV